MLDSIVDLTTARPHMRTSAQRTPGELRAYSEGYYWGVVMSLRVAEEAIHRFALYRIERRAAKRAQRSA